MLSDDLAKVALLGFNTSEFITFTFSVCVLDFILCSVIVLSGLRPKKMQSYQLKNVVLEA